MKSRNFMILRSIAFGIVTKIAGSFLVFIGLPVIAHRLSSSDYATFLRAMSAASFLTLALGATVPVAIRSLSKAVAAANSDDMATAESSSMGLFLISMAASTMVTVLVVLFANPSNGKILMLAIILCALTGILQWGDSYRVALRSDYRSSMWQLIGNLVMLSLLLMPLREGVSSIIIIYFGSPLLTQAAIIIDLWRERRFSPIPSYNRKEILSQIRHVGPMLFNSSAEYLKIFGSALVLSSIAPLSTYTRYATIVLLVARLVNPLSLITRPLMPAYIDALYSHDEGWLRGIGRAISFGAAFSLIIVLGVADVMPLNWIGRLLPPSKEMIQRRELIFAALFLWGHSCVGVLAPLYIARHKAMIYASTNVILTSLGLLIGAVGTFVSFTGAMLTAMAIATALAGTILMLFLVGRNSMLGEGSIEGKINLFRV